MCPRGCIKTTKKKNLQDTNELVGTDLTEGSSRQTSGTRTPCFGGSVLSSAGTDVMVFVRSFSPLVGGSRGLGCVYLVNMKPLKVELLDAPGSHYDCNRRRKRC